MTAQNTLPATIWTLINRKTEGSYWDFKRKHHEHNANLVHDVLCLANTTKHLGPRFLIFGVDDKDYPLHPIDTDPDRRTQADITSLFRDNARGTHAEKNPQRLAMGTCGAVATRKGRRPRTIRKRQSGVPRSRFVDCPYRCPMARFARRVRAVELGVPALPEVGTERRFRARFRGIVGRCRLRVRAHRRHHRAAPPTRRWGKRGTRSQAIGRSRGGPSTKISVMVDALGNLVDFALLPGQRHKFFQDRFPEFYLEEINLDGKLLDVLVIEDAPHKPYYLVVLSGRKLQEPSRSPHLYPCW